MPDIKEDNIIRISRSHNASFYVRASTQFLQGMTGKDGQEKPVFDIIVVSALGAAIPTAATVTGILEKQNVGTIQKIETGYTELEFGKRPQILVTVKRNPDYVAPPKEERKGKGAKKDFPTPECPERLKTDKLEKKMKKVLKEGGKRGVEIEGAADMGGLRYFCTKVLESGTDLDMLVESVKAMNAKCDPSEEERKGGSGAIGKVVMSMGESNDLCVVAYCAPEDRNLDADTWLKGVLKKLEVDIELREDSNPLYAQVHIKNNEEKGLFCMKLRDYVIQHANGYLREKGLVPEAEEEDEDEFVFGDDDFP